MNTALRDLCVKIQSNLDLSAGIGHPNDLEADIVLWPWRISSAQPLNRDLPFPSRSDGSRAQSPRYRFDLSFLMLSPNDFGNLIRAAVYALENPMLLVESTNYKLSEQPLSAELQAALLAGAGIRMQPVMNYVLVGHPSDG